MKGMIFLENGNSKTVGVAALLSNKVDFVLLEKI